MGVASGCGEQEVGVASGSGWNLWVWLLGVVVRRYIDFLILLIPTPLVSVLFCSSIPTFFPTPLVSVLFCSSIPTFLFIFLNVFRSFIIYHDIVCTVLYVPYFAVLYILIIYVYTYRWNPKTDAPFRSWSWPYRESCPGPG